VSLCSSSITGSSSVCAVLAIRALVFRAAKPKLVGEPYQKQLYA
jgi:hypothetical protein